MADKPGSKSATTVYRKNVKPIITPPKKVIKEDVPTDEDIVGMQSPLRKIQYEISKAKGKQVR